MVPNHVIKRAKKLGKDQADQVLKFRQRELKHRSTAVVRMMKKRSIRAVDLDRATAGVLVAEGDSWFDYPFHDVLRLLEDHHGYDVESVAQKGDRIEDMAYAEGQLEELARRLEKLLRRGDIPRAILLSGGGNDVAGEEFGMLLNHKRSAIAGLNDDIIEGVIGRRVQVAYVTIISRVTRVCEQKLGRRIPILLHGYDYAVPDGRGFMGGWWLFPGPWLEPGFRQKGFAVLAERLELVKRLIDRFNEMLAELASLSGFDHVRYVNLRGTLSSGSDYKTYWANEMHPTARGFALVVAKFVAVLDSLP